MGQMDLYLEWLDHYERQVGEEAPLGLILCAEVSREQVELLEMHKDGIAVAEYWTVLPPKAELEAKLDQLSQRWRLGTAKPLEDRVGSPVAVQSRKVPLRTDNWPSPQQVFRKRIGDGTPTSTIGTRGH